MGEKGQEEEKVAGYLNTEGLEAIRKWPTSVKIRRQELSLRRSKKGYRRKGQN
jgi:hypothetical protein